MISEYEAQIQAKLEEASESGLTNSTALMEEYITQVRKLAEEAGIDISKRVQQIERVGYRSGAIFKLVHARQAIIDGKPNIAKAALYLAQKYSSRAEDDETFFEAEELLKGLEDKLKEQ